MISFQDLFNLSFRFATAIPEIHNLNIAIVNPVNDFIQTIYDNASI